MMGYEPKQQRDRVQPLKEMMASMISIDLIACMETAGHCNRRVWQLTQKLAFWLVVLFLAGKSEFG